MKYIEELSWDGWTARELRDMAVYMCKITRTIDNNIQRGL